MAEVDSVDQTGDTEEVKRLKEVTGADTARLGGKAEMFARQESSASTLSSQSWCESPETCHTWDMQSVVTSEFYFQYLISTTTTTVRAGDPDMLTPIN